MLNLFCFKSFLEVTLLKYPDISPTIVKFGAIEIRWYGFMYVLGFIIAYFIIKSEVARKKLNYTVDDISDFIFYLVVGVLLGGRLGYVLFYNFNYYFSNPIEIIMINKGGMSFHGGLIGTIIATYVFSKRRKFSFFQLADMGVLAGSLGLGFGRIGNFINAELYGRVTSPDFPLAMIFPNAGPEPRHPSQLYESFFEGFLMFGILYFLSRKNLKDGTLFGTFIMLYGLFRFFIEYARQPDAHLNFVFMNFSMGQVLCFPMIFIGLVLIILVNRKNRNKTVNENESSK
jgi:phosphatidylglycerol:prolipoprotein diacylglycerol transferase